MSSRSSCDIPGRVFLKHKSKTTGDISPASRGMDGALKRPLLIYAHVSRGLLEL